MTAEQIAQETGCSVRTIQAVARRLGFEKTASVYNLNRQQVNKLIGNLHYKRGHPRKEGKR